LLIKRLFHTSCSRAVSQHVWSAHNSVQVSGAARGRKLPLTGGATGAGHKTRSDTVTIV